MLGFSTSMLRSDTNTQVAKAYSSNHSHLLGTLTPNFARCHVSQCGDTTSSRLFIGAQLLLFLVIPKG